MLLRQSMGEKMIKNISKFCSKNPTRFSINSPYSFGEYTYATDGYIIIRLPKIDDIKENPEAPDPSKIFFGRGSEKTIPIDFEIPFVRTEIEKCFCVHDECSTCSCTENCENCDGKGSVTYKVGKPVKIKDACFNPYYFTLIKELPEVTIQETPLSSEAPLYFLFKGGDGLLMPIRNTGDEDCRMVVF